VLTALSHVVAGTAARESDAVTLLSRCAARLVGVPSNEIGLTVTSPTVRRASGKTSARRRAGRAFEKALSGSSKASTPVLVSAARTVRVS
jgi:hypothetical protein